MDPAEFIDRRNTIAVVGVSENPKKYGHQLYKKLLSAGYRVYPINPRHDYIGGKRCYPSLSSLPEKPDVVLTVVPPGITERVVEEAADQGIGMVWMQPGSESEKAVDFCRKHKIKLMYNACFVVDGLRDTLNTD